MFGVNSQVRAVLFDIDGTLVDSNDAHAHAWVKAFAEAGYTSSSTASGVPSGWAATS